MELEEQYDRLLRYCYMRLRDPTLAEDITQSAFLRFFESKNYRDLGKEMAYLYTIAGNLCVNHFRKHKEELLEDLPPETQQALLTDAEPPYPADRISIEAALDRLPADERCAVVLRYCCGLSVSDAGKVLGLSRFAVYRRLSSAMEKLRKEMEEYEKI